MSVEMACLLGIQNEIYAVCGGCCCTIVQVTRIIKAKWRIIGPNITGESFSYVFMSHNGAKPFMKFYALDKKILWDLLDR